YVNVIVADKQEHPQYLSIKDAIAHCSKGVRKASKTSKAANSSRTPKKSCTADNVAASSADWRKDRRASNAPNHAGNANRTMTRKWSSIKEARKRTRRTKMKVEQRQEGNEEEDNEDLHSESRKKATRRTCNSRMSDLAHRSFWAPKSEDVRPNISHSSLQAPKSNRPTQHIPQQPTRQDTPDPAHPTALQAPKTEGARLNTFYSIT
ncbi:hypothetical protein TI39_contig4292g00001, partial [Zymoseptoria brevis]